MFVEKKHRKQEAVIGTLICWSSIVTVGLLFRSISIALILSFLCSLPVWLPYLIVKARFMIFERLNKGTTQNAIQLPNDEYDADVFDYLYNHPNVNLRSNQKDVGLSDFFWYLLAPAHFIHQEHLETHTKKYQILSGVTKSIINQPKSILINLCTKYINELDLFNIDNNNEKSKTKTQTQTQTQTQSGNGRGKKFSKVVHLRQFFFPLFIHMFYELIFNPNVANLNGNATHNHGASVHGSDVDAENVSASSSKFELCDDKVLNLIIGGADDVITALKFLKVRNMNVRHRLTDYLLQRVKNGDVKHLFSAEMCAEAELTDLEIALYLQGVVLVTGVVQCAEAMAHICLTFAQNATKSTPDDCTRHTPNEIQSLHSLQSNEMHLTHFINEIFRVYPLFGIAHRITSADIAIPPPAMRSSLSSPRASASPRTQFGAGAGSDRGGGSTTAMESVNGMKAQVIEKGTVLCFNYPKYHRCGYKNANEFEPARWQTLKERHSHFIPFGAKENRPCPARNISWIWIKFICQRMLQNGIRMYTPILHTRSMPDGGVCLMTRDMESDKVYLTVAMIGIWFMEQFVLVYHSVLQLVCGSYMLWDAKKKQLAKNWCHAEAARARARQVISNQ